MAALLPSIDEIKQAQELVYSVMPPTPQFSWPLLSNRLGTEVWVKHENHTPIGAFKARTAIVYAAELFKNGNHIKGLIAATRGNHGQSVALAAKRFKVPCTIVVPYGNSKSKNAAMQAQGANLIEFGNDFQEAREHTDQLAAQQQFHIVPAYHYNIVKGVAIGRAILRHFRLRDGQNKDRRILGPSGVEFDQRAEHLRKILRMILGADYICPRLVVAAGGRPARGFEQRVQQLFRHRFVAECARTPAVLQELMDGHGRRSGFLHGVFPLV